MTRQRLPRGRGPFVSRQPTGGLKGGSWWPVRGDSASAAASVVATVTRASCTAVTFDVDARRIEQTQCVHCWVHGVCDSSQPSTQHSAPVTQLVMSSTTSCTEGVLKHSATTASRRNQRAVVVKRGRTVLEIRATSPLRKPVAQPRRTQRIDMVPSTMALNELTVSSSLCAPRT